MSNSMSNSISNSISNSNLACIILGIMGDQIGFNNGKREFQFIDKIPKYTNNNFITLINEFSTYMILEFIKDGGIQGINLNKLSYSDDSLLLLCNMKALLNQSDVETFIQNQKEEYIKLLDIENDLVNKYQIGTHTLQALKRLKNGVDNNYEKYGGGSGASMRSAIFGIYFNNVDMIIQYSTEQAITTHFNGIAIIGSCINSLFVFFGKNKLKPSTWIFKVYELIPTIDAYIKNNYNSIYNEYLIDRNIFVAKLKFYMDDNFLQGNYKHNEIREINPVERILYWFDNFTTNKNNFFPGSASDDSIIIAYDCFLMSKNNYEKLIYLSMLNLGDSDTIGMIASNFYGIYYEFENVPLNLMNEHTEFQLVKKLLKKLKHQKLKSKKSKIENQKLKPQ